MVILHVPEVGKLTEGLTHLQNKSREGKVSKMTLQRVKCNMGQTTGEVLTLEIFLSSTV